MIRVFVYGTLRKDMYNYEIYYKGHVVHHQRAYVKGEMYTIKDKVYPGLRPGNRMIVGDVMNMDETFSLDAVDDMEGFYGEGNVNNEYDKIVCPIYGADQKTILDHLPVYMYNITNPEQKDSLETLIECNDYVEFMKTKK